jgi:dTDP-glucose 4,6-dehydratase
MKNILITGGAGFIGSHLCEKLLKDGFRVFAMDNLLTGRMENISHLQNNPNFKFIRHDVSKYITIENKLDYILHFASPASPIDYQLYPIQTLKVGSLGTHNSLGLAKAKGAVFLLASTSEVYGDPLVNPQKEDYWGNVNCIGPRGVYDEAKRFAEAITLAYHRTHKIDTKIVRIFNTFGERMRKNDGRAVPNFITQALNNQPLTVYGDGSQTRSFCYVSDLVEGLCRLLFSGLNQPVNMGNPGEITLLELAGKIIDIAGSKSKVVFRPLPVDDPKLRCPDITRAKKHLRWEPKTGLKEGLTRTISWFKKTAE